MTADDDLLYRKNWLELLLNKYVQNPNYIICHRCHQVSFKNSHIAPYNSWAHELTHQEFPEASYNLFPTSGAGVLFPPHSLHPDVMKENIFMKLSPTADDVWFWAMALHNNTSICLCENNHNHITSIPGTDDNGTALAQINCRLKQNDIYISNILRSYPDIIKKLRHMKRVRYQYRMQIPLYESRTKQGKTSLSIFGIQIFKRQKCSSVTKYYLCGIQIYQRRK